LYPAGEVVVACARLIHPFPSAIVVATSVIMLAAAQQRVPQPLTAVRVGCVVLLSQISIGALNDYLDREVDARTQPDKPLPSGLVSPGAALALAIASGALVVPAALTFGPWAGVLAGVGTAAGIAYDLWLKPTPLSFLAYVVAFLSLATWVWLVSGKLTSKFALVYPAGAALLITAHLANAFPDIESDRDLGQRGLAVLLGPVGTLRLLTALYSAGALAGAGLSLWSGTRLALACCTGGLAIVWSTYLFGMARIGDRASRKTVFRLVAAALAVLAFGCLLAFARLP
jgi:4-hydroxybenzoate polyprenyltransferase